MFQHKLNCHRQAAMARKKRFFFFFLNQTVLKVTCILLQAPPFNQEWRCIDHKKICTIRDTI